VEVVGVGGREVVGGLGGGGVGPVGQAEMAYDINCMERGTRFIPEYGR